MKKYIGIDLGTTYSCISMMDDLTEIPEVVMNMDGDVTTPSVVLINEMGSVVGKNAKRRLKTMPDQTVELAKREMGTDKTWTILDETYTPVDISSIILKEVFRPVEQEGITDYNIVITCPASYTQNQRRFVIDAAEKAGLNKPEIVNEPTAAALLYCTKNNKETGNVLVFDLGGGTLDVTAVHFDNKRNVYEVLASDGKPYLGGVDWDKVIEDMLYDIAADAFGKSAEELHEDISIASSIKNESERIKKELSNSDFSDTIYLKGEPLDVEISQHDFENRTSGLLTEATGMIQTVMDIVQETKDQHTDVSNFEIDDIVLVGGSCYMPQVKTAIQREYPDYAERIWIFEPNTSISKGAALFAKYGIPEEYEETAGPAPEPVKKFIEVLSDTLGTDERQADGTILCRNIMFKNDVIPGSSNMRFGLSGGQTRLVNKVFSNKCRDRSQKTCPIEDCIKIAEFEMELPFVAYENEVIIVTFDIGVNGILKFILTMREKDIEYNIPMDGLKKTSD